MLRRARSSEAPQASSSCSSTASSPVGRRPAPIAFRTGSRSRRLPRAPTEPSSVEPPHFALGLGALEQLLGLRFLLSRGFAHAGIGWSTASFGDGLDLRILDPGADRVVIDGGVTDGNGRTDDEIVVDFARALTSDGHARAMLGRVDRRYLTGFSDSSDPVLRLVASGRAEGAFEFVLPVVAEAHESPIGPRCRALSRQGHRRRLRGRVRHEFVDARRRGRPIPLLRGRRHAAHARLPRVPVPHDDEHTGELRAGAASPLPPRPPLGRRRQGSRRPALDFETSSDGTLARDRNGNATSGDLARTARPETAVRRARRGPLHHRDRRRATTT